MILPEEFSDAWDGSIACLIGCIVFAFAFVIFLTATVASEGTSVRTWSVPTVACGIAAVGCLVGLIRRRRIIRAWRDERRVEAAIAEAKKDGDA